MNTTRQVDRNDMKPDTPGTPVILRTLRRRRPKTVRRRAATMDDVRTWFFGHDLWIADPQPYEEAIVDE